MAALLAMQPLVAAWAPDHILRINNATVAADCTERQSVTINGTSPGPTLRVKESDESVWIRVYNDMEAENTTLHWQCVDRVSWQEDRERLRFLQWYISVRIPLRGWDTRD